MAAYRRGMGNKEYWLERSKEQVLDYWKVTENVEKALLKNYKRVHREISKEVDAFLLKFVKENENTLSKAQQLLPRKALKELKEDLEYWEAKYMKYEITDKEFRSKVRAFKTRKRVTYLDELLLNIEEKVAGLHILQEQEVTNHLKDIFGRGYKDSADRIATRAGMSNFGKINQKQLEEAIKYPFHGEMFSDRIWEDKRKLVRKLKQELTHSLTVGKNPRETGKKFAEIMGTSEFNATRLIRTETSQIINRSTLRAGIESGVVKGYEIVATLDRKTSFVCRNKDGQIVLLAEAVVGISIPPFHPHCRTFILEILIDDVLEDVAGFKDAKTIGEAEQIVKDFNLADRVDYKGIDVAVANDWNKALYETVSRFPELRKNFKFVGTTQARNNYYVSSRLDEYVEKLKKINPGFDNKALIEYAKKRLRKSIGKVKSSIYAQSMAYEDLTGVTVNKAWGSKLIKLKEALKRDVEIKFHPVGCESIKSVIDHEIGHQLDDLLNISMEGNIQKLYNKYSKEELTEKLSRYSWDNNNSKKIREFVAEGWAEFNNNPEPREVAKEIGETILRRYEEWKKIK